MEFDPMDERELYNKYHHSDNVVSTTISTIVVQGGPLQLVIALLRVRNFLIVTFSSGWFSYHCQLKSLNMSSSWRLLLRLQMQITIRHNVILRHEVLNGDDNFFIDLLDLVRTTLGLMFLKKGF